MTAHGTLGLPTPWTRALFPRETRAEVEALIPTGFRINVTAVNGKPGPWNLRAYRVGEPDVEVKAWLGRRDPRTACRVLALELQALVTS